MARSSISEAISFAQSRTSSDMDPPFVLKERWKYPSPRVLRL
jgi:hypothetical protein